MKLKVVSKKIFNYIRYDLKEIAFPSSLPDPPHLIKKPRRKRTWIERYELLRTAIRLYVASFSRDIGPELRALKSNGKVEKQEMEEDKSSGEKDTDEPSVLEDLAVAAKGGMETLRPALQRVYMTKASTYRDAAKSFIQGYQEGIHQVMEEQKEQQSKIMEEQQQQRESKVMEEQQQRESKVMEEQQQRESKVMEEQEEREFDVMENKKDESLKVMEEQKEQESTRSQSEKKM